MSTLSHRARVVQPLLVTTSSLLWNNQREPSRGNIQIAKHCVVRSIYCVCTFKHLSLLTLSCILIIFHLQYRR